MIRSFWSLEIAPRVIENLLSLEAISKVTQRYSGGSWNPVFSAFPGHRLPPV
jgi:hypothetical protein